MKIIRETPIISNGRRGKEYETPPIEELCR